jgi:hypothetical protein
MPETLKGTSSLPGSRTDATCFRLALSKQGHTNSVHRNFVHCLISVLWSEQSFAFGLGVVKRQHLTMRAATYLQRAAASFASTFPHFLART